MGSGALTAPQIAQILNAYKGNSSWYTMREVNESNVDKKTGSPTYVKLRRWRRKDRKLYVADLWMRSREGEGTLVAIGNSSAAKAIMSLTVEMGEMANEVFGGKAKRSR